MTINVTVSLDGPNDTGANLRLHFTTLDGDASAPEDYVQVSGDVIFRPGDRTKTIPIVIQAGSELDPEEYFTVELSLLPTSGMVQIGNAVGVVTLIPKGVDHYIPIAFK
jgi:hypothetical protein